MHEKQGRRSALRALRQKYRRLLPEANSPIHAGTEAAALLACVNHFKDVLALAASWSGRDSKYVARSLLRALVHRLELDFAYVRLSDAVRTDEWFRLGASRDNYASRQEFLDAISAGLQSGTMDSNDIDRRRIGRETLSVVCYTLESARPASQLVVGCRRNGFPGDIERLALNMAADQAAIALRAAFTVESLASEIAERTRANAEVEPVPISESQARTILNNIPAFVVVLTAAGEIEHVNAQTLRYLGKTLDELKRWSTSGIVHPDDLPRSSEVFKRSIESGAAYDIEQRLLGSTGDYRWFRANGIPLRSDNGGVDRWYVVLFDIDDRKRAEEHLRESERELRQNAVVIEEGQRLSQTGTFYWNTVTDELRFSDENCRINGLEPGTPVTMELMASRIHPDDQGLIQQKIEANRNDRNEADYEIRLQMPDKQVKWVHTTARRFVNEEGQLEYIGAVRDITERHNAEVALSSLRSELAHLSRVSSLGALTASIAHEVNQPLSGILTNASTALRMLSVDSPNVSGALETVRRTIRDAHRASDVIGRLRVMFSRKDTVREEVHLNETAREVVTLSLAEFQRSGLSLRTQFAEDLPAVYGDRVQLQQVILNLLLNASDAMKGVEDRSRQVLLKTNLQQDGDVRLTVVDAGDGIPPEHADRLFEPFFTTKTAGMGIGLYVSRSIIERHRGRLWAEPNEGFGTSFSFSIPPGAK